MNSGVMHIFILPTPFVVCSCMYASLKPENMHEKVTKEIGKGKYLNDCTLFWVCKPVLKSYHIVNGSTV